MNNRLCLFTHIYVRTYREERNAYNEIQGQIGLTNYIPAEFYLKIENYRYVINYII